MPCQSFIHEGKVGAEQFHQRMVLSNHRFQEQLRLALKSFLQVLVIIGEQEHIRF